MSDNDSQSTTSSLPEGQRIPASEQKGDSTISDEAWASATSRWIDDHIRNSAVAGSTEAWNRLHGVLPKLREYLETELGRK